MIQYLSKETGTEAGGLDAAGGDETERAYRRGDTLMKRRELMTAWGDWLDGKEEGEAAKVVSFASREKRQ